MAALASKFIALLLWISLPLSTNAFIVSPGASFVKGIGIASSSTKPIKPTMMMMSMSTSSSSSTVNVEDCHDNDNANVKAATSTSSLPLVVASSLASSYAIRMHPASDLGGGRNELMWELHALDHWEQHQQQQSDRGKSQGEGTLALRALNDCAQLDMNMDGNAVCTISCQWDHTNHNDDDAASAWSINVAPTNEDDADTAMPRELLCVLSRIMVQSAASQIIASKLRSAEQETENETLLRITLPLLEGDGCQQLQLSDLLPAAGDGDNDNDDLSGLRNLFTPLNSQYADMEIVDMVDHEGRVMGSLPRPYVHTWNILHRGIGMVVSKDADILEALRTSKSGKEKEVKGALPDVYVHQRTSTKRVFPSLYDMFVGGVSSSGEDAKWTAAREVAEELGLQRSLDILQDKDESNVNNNNNPLSEKLFQCTICTSYNRCVVSMFTYTCDTSLESITWQEEEVAWGEYCPYDIIELAAELSIDRLVEQGVWPGSGIRSDCDNNEKNKSAKEEKDDCDEQRDDNNKELVQSDIEESKTKYHNDVNNQSWDTWDFVPDGLLVWEAWKSFVSQER